MNIQEFPGCCAALILKDFGSCAHDKTEHTPATIEKFISDQEKNYFKSQYPMLVAILTTEQYRRMGKIFIKRGWRRVSKARQNGYFIHMFTKTNIV